MMNFRNNLTQTTQVSAAAVFAGSVIIGRRGFHLMVESAKRRADGKIVLKGVNGWNEATTEIYSPSDVVSKFTH